jgi:hypothetical protein
MFGDESLAPLIKGFQAGDATEKAIINSRLKARFFSLAFSKDEIQAITFIWPDLLGPVRPCRTGNEGIALRFGKERRARYRHRHDANLAQLLRHGKTHRGSPRSQWNQE